MTKQDRTIQKQIVPRCMRLDEKPLQLPPGGLQSLLGAIAGTAESGSSLADSQLVTFAIHIWRLGRRIEQISEDGSSRTKRPFQDSFSRLGEILDGLGVSIDDPINREFTDGWLEVDVIAWEDPEGPPPDGVTGPWVKQTIKPVLRKSGVLLAKGEIIVADPTNNPEPKGSVEKQQP